MTRFISGLGKGFVNQCFSRSDRFSKFGFFAFCAALAVIVFPATAQIPFDGVRQVAAGYAHTCALTSTGGVKCWGHRSAVGDGIASTVDMSVAVDVVGLVGGVSAIAAGASHNCALLETGAVKCWGRNDNGQLGNNSVVLQRAPIDLIGLSNDASALALGGNHTCVLLNSGNVKCSGANNHGQLGDETTLDKWVLGDVAGLSDLVAISAGAAHTCAITNIGGVKCWGWNGYGQLGDGTITNSATPVDVYGLSSGVIKIDAGSTHTCAVLIGGNVKCWGHNQYGKLGNGSTVQANLPVDVIGLGTPATEVVAGSSHTCALTSIGGVKCWGNNARGQLGNNSISNSTIPVDAVGLTQSVAALSAYDWHSCATTNQNGIKCWGSNTYRQIGTGSTTSDAVIPTTPVQAFSPVMVSASAGDREATISFSPPISDSGSPVTSYAIDMYSNLNHSFVATLGPDERSYRVTGLTNGTPYNFTVTATNALGSGLPRGAVNSVIPSAIRSSSSVSSLAMSSSSIASSLATSSSSIAPGTGSASSSSSSLNACGFVGAIEFGTTYTGTLAVTDCTGGARGTSYYTDRYSFNGAPGQLVAIQLSGSFDTYVNLRDPNGNIVASNDDGGGGSNSRIPATSGYFTIPAGLTGTYVIEVTSYASRATGSYSLTTTSAVASSSGAASSSTSSVSSSCNMAVAVVSGVTSSGVLASTDCTAGARGAGYYTDRYSFTGAAGQLVSIQLTSNVFDTYLYLKNPAGALIASNDDGGGGTNSRIPATSGNFTLPASGTFVIEATSYSTQRTGAYVLVFTRQ